LLGGHRHGPAGSDDDVDRKLYKVCRQARPLVGRGRDAALDDDALALYVAVLQEPLEEAV
jgi:hypothetical protein